VGRCWRRTQAGPPINLRDVANVYPAMGPTSIARENQNRILRLTGDVLTEVASIGEVSESLRGRLAGLELPEGYAILYGGEEEAIRESNRQLATVVLLAIFMVEEKPQPGTRSINWGVALAEAGLFSILFVAGRTIRYLTIGAGYEPEEQAAVMLWTAAIAVMIALNYVFLKSAFQKGSVRQSALRFTFILFGLHYMLFVYFVPLIFSGLFFDLTIVLAYDLILVLLASILTGELTAGLSTQMMPETISYETTNH